MMTIEGVKNRFSADFAAARELVREKYGKTWVRTIKAFRAETGASLESAMMALAEGRVDLRWLPRIDDD